MPWWLYLIGTLVVLAFLVLWLYNRVVSAKNQAVEAWSGVEVQLRRRRDLVPNLVAAVAAYAQHEQAALQVVTEMRAAANAAAHHGAALAAPAENRLTGSLRGLFAVAERYPQLKADGNFLQLQRALVDTENNVQGARAIYNGNARRYNDRIQMLPTSLFIGYFGFRALPYAESAATERGVGRIDFA